MRNTSLTIAIAASLLMLGFAGQARADLSCAQRNLPNFSRDLNRNAAWNPYVISKLTAPNQWPGWTQLRDGFKTQQCATAWGNGRTYIGVTHRYCTFVPPTPLASGTSINYGASATNPAIIQLRGCGGLVRELPAQKQ